MISPIFFAGSSGLYEADTSILASAGQAQQPLSPRTIFFNSADRASAQVSPMRARPLHDARRSFGRTSRRLFAFTPAAAPVRALRAHDSDDAGLY